MQRHCLLVYLCFFVTDLKNIGLLHCTSSVYVLFTCNGHTSKSIMQVFESRIQSKFVLWSLAPTPRGYRLQLMEHVLLASITHKYKQENQINDINKRRLYSGVKQIFLLL